MPRWKKILYALLIAGSVTACAVFAWSAFRKPDTCADGIERIGGECIGVNGDGYDFGTPEIRDVARAIARENKRIESQPYVTVAMMLPLQSERAELRRQMRSDLQGAYLGQRQANEGEGEPPKIRLVLANPGRNYGQQEQVVDTLLRMADSAEDRLRAVTGFNLSLDATEEAVERLTDHQVPVLASRISGDGIANKDSADGMAKLRFPGLARILPTNHDAAQALANFNGERGRENVKTVLVYDKRADAYNESLAKAFSGIEEKGPPGPAAMSFESPSIDEPGSTGNQFTQIANNICDSEADTVYFAGRTLHLRIFALKLAQVGCKDRHYTIVSGSDAASLRQAMTEKDWEQLRGEDGHAKVTVQYAAPAHPGRLECRAGPLERQVARGSRPRARQGGPPPVPHRAEGGPGHLGEADRDHAQRGGAARLRPEPGGLPHDARVRRPPHHRQGTAPGPAGRRRDGTRPGGCRQTVVAAPVPAPGAGHERPHLPHQRRQSVRQAGRGRRTGSGPRRPRQAEVRRTWLAHRPGAAEELRDSQQHPLSGVPSP
ncbi:amino acid ABC transporter substrate-binding protein [Streptomyces sp. CA-251387]|uniref:amino acid ABC transporter substrate-binding protein n=1 Tax=Streptomyces sp. CA-251387 TaxID=3240064 RepID=UPI003D923B61